jgi:hypothetical protein
MVGLRERKAAKIKLAILDEIILLLKKMKFKQINVMELCDSIDISKVTFFKYFPKKEETLIYFMNIWCLRQLVNLKKNGKKGVAATQLFFSSLAKDYKANPNLMLALIGFIANLDKKPTNHKITAIEKKLLFPDDDEIGNVEIMNIHEILEKHLKEAEELKEIDLNYSINDRLNLLASLFYGTALTAHTKRIMDVELLYKRNLKFVFNS